MVGIFLASLFTVLFLAYLYREKCYLKGQKSVKKIEDDLIRKGKMFDCLLENAPLILFCKDPKDEFRYTIWNKKSEELLGLSSSQVVGKNDVEVGFPDENNRIVKNLEENLLDCFLSTGMFKSGDLVEHIEHTDGKNVTLKTWESCIDDGQGNPMIFGMAVDVTKDQEISDERTRLIKELKSVSARERVINECLSILVSNEDEATLIADLIKHINQSISADITTLFKLTEDESGAVTMDNCAKDEGVFKALNKRGYILQMSQFKMLLDELKKNNYLLIEDALALPLEDPDALNLGADGVVKSFIVSKVMDEDKLWGFIVSSYYEARKFDEMDAKVFEAISKNLSLAITRLRHTQEIKASEREKMLILDNIVIPIHLFDKEGNLLYINEYGARYWGKPRDYILSGDCHRTICGLDAPPPACPIQEVKQTSKTVEREFVFPTKSFISIAIPVFDEDGELMNIVECDLDTTLQNQAKSEIEKAKDAAEAAVKTKSLFLATMSHEIRTPLNAILGLSELLLMDNQDKTSKSFENIYSINTAGTALLSIINDVLELSKIEADKLNLVYSWIPIQHFSDEVKSIFSTLASSKGLKLDFVLPEHPKDIYMCETAIRQILLNLVGNAIKFTNSGGVTLSFIISDIENDTCNLRISVKDTGRGVHKDDFGKIFDPFEQLEHRQIDVTKKGSGLGLAIVFRMVEKLGGKIGLESEVGVGSDFFADLPKVAFKEHQEVSNERLVGKFTSAENLKIWVIDDVEMNCRVLGMMLQRLGAKVETFTSVLAALDAAKAGNYPDVIMTDMWMPEMNGDQFAKSLSMIAPWIPIVAVTADTEVGDNFSTEAFVKVLLKPLSMEKLDKFFKEFYQC